jgi:intein/homing endonuclease
VRTRTGREVRVSSEHPFLTPTGWQKASSLQTGDRIAIPRQIPIRGESQPIPRLQKEYGRTSTRWPTLPERTSTDFWRWMGYFMAEGWVQRLKTTCRFWWSNGDPTIRADFVRLTRTLFGFQVKQRPDAPNDHYFDSLPFLEFFEALGLGLPVDAGSKRVPPALFRCPAEEIAAFLQGYFDGDAGVGQRDGLHVVSKSERLAKDVQYLLNRLGVIAFLRPRWSRAAPDQPRRWYHEISVYGDELVTLSRHFSLRSTRKQERVEQLVARRLAGKRPTNWDTIPIEAATFKAVRTGLGLTWAATGHMGPLQRLEHRIGLPSRPMAQHFVERFRAADHEGRFAPEIDQMAFLASERVAWDHIDSIEAVAPDTDCLYDFTMESAPNFVGNGVLLHNTHVFTTITGAMKNAFGGLLNKRRHWTHGVIHETLVDLLQIQQDIHSGLFAVMDGTFAGDGPGPRAMRWHEKDILLASADQVAIDAISAKLQGFDPMSLGFIRLADERGLGVGNPDEIEIVGHDLRSEPAWNFVQEDTFASRGQKMIYHGWLKSFEKPLLRSPVVPWAYFASNFYHNVYWYPFVGRQRVQDALATKWGRMFKEYGDGTVVLPGMHPKTVKTAVAGTAIAAAGIYAVTKALSKRRTRPSDAPEGAE